MVEQDHELSAGERADVLAAWPGASAPAGFAARVARRARRPSGRPLVLAALAVAAAAAALFLAILWQDRSAAESRARLVDQRAAAMRQIAAEEARQARAIDDQIQALQGQIVAANQADRARLERQLAQRQDEMAVLRKRANDARKQIKSTGKTAIDLGINTSDALGGVKGQ